MLRPSDTYLRRQRKHEIEMQPRTDNTVDVSIRSARRRPRTSSWRVRTCVCHQDDPINA